MSELELDLGQGGGIGTTFQIPIANLGNGTFTIATPSTVTGTQNNLNIGVVGDTYVEWSGAADVTITGITNGAAGKYLIVKNTGANVAYFAHLSGSSSAANQFVNLVTSGTTPVAPKGWIAYLHNGTNWNLVGHEQGVAISVAYSGGNFTSDVGSWTVAVGDQATFLYKLIGNYIALSVAIVTSTITGTPTFLFVTLPNGFSITSTQSWLPGYAFDGVALVTPTVLMQSVGTTIRAQRTDVATWPNATDTMYWYFDILVSIT